MHSKYPWLFINEEEKAVDIRKEGICFNCVDEKGAILVSVSLSFEDVISMYKEIFREE